MECDSVDKEEEEREVDKDVSGEMEHNDPPCVEVLYPEDPSGLLLYCLMF